MFFSKQHLISLGKTGPLRIRRCQVAEDERRTHTYVIGVTGKGKSKLLEQMLVQDIVSGKGCGVLDPHGELATDLIRNLKSNADLAQHHWNRIIYFDPTNAETIIPFNVLNSEFSAYETAQNVVEAFRRTWPQALREAPRFADVATVSILTLIQNKLSLVELQRLLTDETFREALLQNIKDEEIKSFWYDRYERWGRETPRMTESLLNKISAFTLNPHLKLLLGADENRLSFRSIMDDGKVLIVDLGNCDGETRRLVGSLIVTGIEQAARSRRNMQNRKPFFFCIDEFQDFCSNDGAAQTLSQILSECRKFGLYLTLAHQTLAQVSARMQGALGNVQLKIIFGISREDAEVIAKHLFRVDTKEIKHVVEDDTAQERSHPVFYSLPEQWELFVQQLQALKPRQALVKRPRKDQPVTIRTHTIAYQVDHDSALSHCQTLMQQVGQPRDMIQQQIAQRVESIYAG